MSRPSIQSLYSIDPKTLLGLKYEDALILKADAIMVKKKNLSLKLHRMHLDSKANYEETSVISYELKYLNKALQANVDDLAELGIQYRAMA